MKKWLLMTTALALVGCTTAPKQTETIRQARPDDPKEAAVPSSISRLLPDNITEENAKQVANQLSKDLKIELDRAEKSQRTAPLIMEAKKDR